MNHFGRGGWVGTIQMTFRIMAPPRPSGFDGDGVFSAPSLTRDSSTH